MVDIGEAKSAAADYADIERDSRGILDPGRMLQHVRFRRIPPPHDLAEVVEWFWAVRWSFPAGQEFVQDVLAHPTANLSVGPASSRAVPGSGWLDRDDVEATAVGVVTGLDRRRLRGDGWNVAAKLRPGALGAVLRFPARDLTDCILPLGDVADTDDAALVRDICERADDVDAQVDVLAATLRSVLRSADPTRLTAACAAQRIGSMIQDDRSIRSVRALAARSGYGARSLQRLFVEHAGVSPLWMIRRYRLIDAADAARSGRPPSWAKLAAELGYADQAHLTRDFKASLGTTPAEYAQSVRPVNGSRGAQNDGAV